MIRKILPALLAVLLVCSFTGCRGKTTTNSTVSSTVSNAASGAQSGAASPSPGTESANNGASSAQNGTNNGTTNGTDGAENGGVTSGAAATGLGTFREALRGVYGEKYYPDTQLTEAEIREELGMDNTLYEEIYAERSAQNAHPDMFVAVKVKDGKTEEVKQKLTAYKQRLLENNNFAAHTEKINAAEIYAEGDYVFFVLLGDVEDNVSSEGFAEAFGKEIQRGIDAIKKAIGAM